MRLAMSVPFLATGDLVEAPDEAGDQVQRHDDDDQRERRAPHAVGGVVGTGDRVAVARVHVRCCRGC